MATKKNANPIILQYGAEGATVRKAQRCLRNAGSKIQVNGIYTIGMTTAVKSFQKKHCLTVTGKIDAKTLIELEKYSRAPAKKKVK